MTTLARAPLALAAALLLAGLALGRSDGRNRIPLPIRMLSSGLVLLAALLAARRGGRAARLAARGMGCGFLGDLIMARVIPLPQHVVGGMLAFGAGHALYIRAMLVRAQGANRPIAPFLAGGWAVALAGWWALARNPDRGPALNAAALIYALLLGSMAGLGATRAARLAAGGGLFLLSDLILAGELFRDLSFPNSGDVIWLTYIAGQALIVDGLGDRG